jgi:hypothetical protein
VRTGCLEAGDTARKACGTREVGQGGNHVLRSLPRPAFSWQKIESSSLCVLGCVSDVRVGAVASEACW